MKLSKKMQSAQLLDMNEELFKCPICSSGIEMVDHKQLVCNNMHTFDLAKTGYVNLAPQAHTTKYDRSLFEARAEVMGSGFFSPVLDKLCSIVADHVESIKQPVILDAGCGEGTHLSAIHSQMKPESVGIGLDLAKEGIAAASKAYPGIIWNVADLAAMPFQDAQIDVILNVLSPANYGEFNRLLKQGGKVVKVVPETGYLQELREAFYEGKPQKEETDPVDRFSEHFEDVETERITYKFALPEGLLAPLIRMTPLTWNAGDERVREVLSVGMNEITIDLRAIVGTRR
ncbi:putative RNA methyltransferase [Sporosarcina highlanderae]|uniref:Methyltransferase domain-containing protein n=1 Tax=Sporosarcina highlanderae TaxID=3035916 RepID=A0ABT8JMQ0_9BACL|nr:methyltransferase domain-containing protein [Sporosarcina highlanderae]MDN4606426.1 methyltransferase domain-containing protein [Sporosarcina highlanderae]